jgi:hypothetical protein
MNPLVENLYMFTGRSKICKELGIENIGFNSLYIISFQNFRKYYCVFTKLLCPIPEFAE